MESIMEPGVEPLQEWTPTGPSEEPSRSWHAGEPVVFDLGAYKTRVGMASADAPAHAFVSRAAKYRDRKASHQVTVAGNGVLLDATARQNAKNLYDGPLLVNWDAAELVFDYSFGLLGVTSTGSVDSPVIVSEPFLGPAMPRNTLAELMFEGYGVPSLGIDSSLSHFDLKTGLVVSGGHEATHLLPYIDGSPDFSRAKRINFGGRQAADFLRQLLALKYPLFPTRVTPGQAELMFQRYCYVSSDYRSEMRHALELPILEKLERIIQAPLQGPAAPVADAAREEEIAARRRESGRRLQEQAAKAREIKRQQQDAEFEALSSLADRAESSDDADVIAAQHGFVSYAELKRTLRKADVARRKARGEEVVEEEPETDLLEVPDDELDEDQIREKKKQRLLKASYDARQKIKREKAERAAHQAERERADREWRETDLEGWSEAKRSQLYALQKIVKERERLARDPSSRRTMQMRNMIMAESILQGSDSGGPSAKRRRAASAAPSGERVETLAELEELEAQAAANDDEEEDEETQIQELQMQLLEHDPTYSLAELENKPDWRTSVVHKFLWGAHDFDPQSQAQVHQLNLNLERIRVPEAFFQPTIAGVDQAGLSEVAADLLTKAYPQAVALKMAKNVHLTGGLANLPGLSDRLRLDLCSALPTGAELSIRTNSEPELDGWRNLARWAQSKSAFKSRRAYEETGPDRLWRSF